MKTLVVSLVCLFNQVSSFQLSRTALETDDGGNSDIQIPSIPTQEPLSAQAIQSFSGNLNLLSGGSSKVDAALIGNKKKPSASFAQVSPGGIINGGGGTCVCVTSGSCGVSSGSSDGSGSLDIRIINVSH